MTSPDRRAELIRTIRREDAFLLGSFAAAEEKAIGHYRHARAGREKGDGFSEAWSKTTGDDLERLNRRFAELRELTPTADCEVELLTRELGIWLALYFAGVPSVELWQEISEGLRRDLALPTVAFTMKAYGDVYRIERRRHVERLKLSDAQRSREDVLERLGGITTVVDHSVITNDGEECELRDAAIRFTSGPNVSARLKEVMSAPLSADADARSTAVRALTERLARYYCALQIARYVQLKLPLDLFLIDGDVNAARKTAAGFLVAGSRQRASYYHKGDQKIVGVPICVVGTHTGVLREEGQWLGSPEGRKFDTRRLADVDEKVRSLQHSSAIIFPMPDS
jgi:hypothetical protein